MNEVSNEPYDLFEKIKGNKKILHFSENKSINELKKVCDASSQLVTILEYGKNSYSIVYANKAGIDFFGVDEKEFIHSGFEFILKTTHPDNIDAVYMLIKFFNDDSNSTNTFTHTLYINSKTGWKWVYSIVKAVTFNEDGTIRYLVSIANSLDDLLDSRNLNTQYNNNANQYKVNIEKYNSMTEREKEILGLIAQEYTSKEIGNMLFISPLTVDTHRKHLIEKLEVKSSIGLIKYALLFNLI